MRGESKKAKKIPWLGLAVLIGGVIVFWVLPMLQGEPSVEIQPMQEPLPTNVGE